MTDRLKIILSGQKSDRVPVVPVLVISYASKVTGETIGNLYKDPKKCIRSQLLAAELHDYEPIPMYGYAEFGGWEFGGDIALPNEKGMAPYVTRHPVNKPDDVEKLEVPDVRRAGSLPLTIEAAKEALRAKYPAAFPAGGIFTWACNIVGYKRIMPWLIKEADLVHKVLRKAVDFSFAVTEYFVEEFGAESCLGIDLAPSEANSLISP